MTTHRARDRLLATLETYRPAYDQAAEWHAKYRDDWPAWCYLPAAGWAEAAGYLADVLGADVDDAAIATLGTWRLTQGIYRIDPTVYAELLRTPVTGEIPGTVLQRLPQWCVYIETPHGVTFEDGPVHGFWAYINHSKVGPSERGALVVDLDTDSLLSTPIMLPFGEGTLEQSMDALMERTKTHNAEAAARLLAHPMAAQMMEALHTVLSQVLPLLLYICTPESMPQRPQNPELTKTKRGLRMFPASTPTMWDVGVRMGAALRAAYAAEPMTTGNPGHSVRGHIRRAHWHGFRSGPRLTPDGQAIPANKRPFELRWMPPIPVNLPDLDNLPATIYKIE